jgi:general secretion pathway protein A
MYQDHWGLKVPPFCRGLDPHFFYASPTHEEALARLDFLVENRRRLGWLTGPTGSGKSLLLEVFAERLRRRGAAVAQMNLLGREVIEVLWQIAADWGLNPEPSSSLVTLWRMLEDGLWEHRWRQQSAVLLFDEAEGAAPQVVTALLRLMQFDESPDARLTVVLAGREERLGTMPFLSQEKQDGPPGERWNDRLLEFVDLRIELESWEQPDTENFLNHSLRQAGQNTPLFSEPAIVRLQELTGGNPRCVSRLADLALVAGAGEELAQIDVEVVDSVSRELCGAEQ